jgi:ADP-L-glycero-D-manno-heptose 6-epimerase
MKVLVTGHRGFIGQNLVKHLADTTDWEVRGWEWGDSNYPTVDGNDWVIHLGAISSTTETDVDKVMRQNYDFSRWLLKSCDRHYVNLQYASSASVYGLASTFKEDTPLDPRNPYSWSKYLFDRHVQQEHHSKIVQGFRYFNVYGNHEEHKGKQASPVTQFRQQDTIKLFKHSEQYQRDFIAVEDVCRLHVEFIKNVTQSGIWNFGTGKTTSFQEVANLIGKPQEFIDMPDQLKNSYQAYTCADLTKLESTVGKQKFISVKDWLTRGTD